LIKDYLLIPIEKDKLDDFNSFNDKNNNNNNDSSLQNISLNDNTNKNTTNYKDYLSKFDSFLNESKLKLKDLESISR
jgi:hypothetical protein